MSMVLERYREEGKMQIYKNCNSINRRKFVDRLFEMDNQELLSETLSAQCGDSWDGCFTKNGEWECNKLTQVLNYRLILIGFLKLEDI